MIKTDRKRVLELGLDVGFMWNRRILKLLLAQKNYIQDYISEFETALLGQNFTDPLNGYAKYIDIDSFIVNDFCSEITREVDTYRYSTFVTKERNGKLKMSPQWDFNLSMGNNDYRNI